MNTASRTQIVLNYSLLVLFSFMALYPVFGVFISSVYPSGTQPSSFKPPPHWDFHNFVTAWTQGHFALYFRSSAIIAIATVVFSTVLSILGGYAFGTMRFRGSKVLFYTFLLGLIIPTEATIVALYYDIRALNLINTYTALILIEVSGEVAFGIFWFRAAFLSAPKSLIEAARIDGASTLGVFRTIVVPLSVPAIAAYGIFQFLWVWNDLLMSLIFVQNSANRPMTVAISGLLSQYGTEWNLLAASAFLLMFVPLAVFFSLQRYFVQGLLAGSVK
jgi:raffinose/stachyose/melibiose transport system permease protein